MVWYAYLLQVLASMLLTNSVPHYVQGVSGAPFQTPFATPSGVGESSPLVNVLWGFGNLVGGAVLLRCYWPTSQLSWIVVGVACLLMATRHARHFGRVRAKA